MTEKHTPGPWVAEDTDDGHRIRMGTALDSGAMTQPQHLVNYDHGLCFDGDLDDDPENRQFLEAEANARLIAASPIGYELASEILRACDPRTGRIISDVTRSEIEPLRKLAERFMAQAEGIPLPDGPEVPTP